MKRVLSLLLSILLILCGCSPAKRVARSYLRMDHPMDQQHGWTRFDDMVLSYPDPDAVIKTLDRALRDLDGSPDPSACISIYEDQVQAYSQLVGAASLAYVLYCQNVTDAQKAAEYGRLNSSLYAIQIRLARLEKALMDRWGYHRERGPAYAEALDRISRQDDAALFALREREDELCRRYERLDAEFQVEYKGRTWTMAELMQDEDMTLQSFLEVLERYGIEKNRSAGDIYLELLSLRREMAKEGGYATCAESQYAAFGREYTPEQALAAAKIVKQVFVPLYVRLRERCENDLRYLSGASFSEDQFIAAMEQAAERAVPGAGEAWRYMIKLGLYDSQRYEQKLQGSFTTYLSNYSCPFLFTQWEDDASSVFTVIHEFGHFLSYYTNPEGTYYAPEDLDLAETDAQGFELLMLPQYEALLGRYATAARLCWLMNALYAILSGFMEDEFQQRAYGLEHPTVESLNRLYGELSKEYGFDRLFGYEGREWTEIGHTFQFPFYYVSYGVSMLGAMALVRDGNKGYRRSLKRKAGASFTEVVGRDVLTEESIRALAAWIEGLADDLLQG